MIDPTIPNINIRNEDLRVRRVSESIRLIEDDSAEPLNVMHKWGNIQIARVFMEK